MKPATAERGLWIATLAFAVFGVVRTGSEPMPMGELPHDPIPQMTVIDAVPLDRIANARDEVVGSDPFRLSRRPSSIAFEAGTSSNETFEPQRSAGLELILAGVLGGPPWQAVLKGVPGRPGSVVVREGESIDDLLIASVTKDSVVVSGADTSWVLKVDGTWR